LPRGAALQLGTATFASRRPLRQLIAQAAWRALMSLPDETKYLEPNHCSGSVNAINAFGYPSWQ